MTRYCLKPMVLARLFAESTVLIAFISVPIILLINRRMFELDLPIQALFYLLGLVGLGILPWFGFLTWQVRVDETGLTSDALFRHQFCAWASMKKITRRANWNWQRYVIEFEGGNLHFPVLLARSSELVQVIREHLPGEASASVGLSSQNPHRVFQYDPVALFTSIVQSVVACVFVALFWFFFAFNIHKHFHSTMDAAMVLIFCLAFTVIFFWRLIVVLSMPRRVELTKERLVLSSLFSSKTLTWIEVVSLATPLPLLPEGFTIRSKRGSFLIGTGMDAADELQQIVIQELSEQRDMQFITAAIERKLAQPAAVSVVEMESELVADGGEIRVEEIRVEAIPPVVAAEIHEPPQTDFAVPVEVEESDEKNLPRKGSDSPV